MNHKERLLAALARKPVDRTPWAPFLTYWWELQTPTIRGMGEIGFCQEIGVDPLVRGHYPTVRADDPYRDLFLFDVEINGCRTAEKISGNEKYRVYETPIGTLHCTYRIDPLSQTWFLTEHPIKEEEDYHILQYMMEHTTLQKNYEEFEEVANFYGDEVLMVPLLVPSQKTAFQSLVEHWVGTEQLAYDLCDYPETVEETIDAMRRVSRQAAYIGAESSAEVLLSFEDSSTTNYSPAMFEKYVVPEMNEWCDILHDHGKLFMHHACGYIKDLLPCIAASKSDCLESFSPRPTGNVELRDIKDAIGERKSLVGGIEPTCLLNMSLDELHGHVKEILAVMNMSGYVLANSDSCPPGVEIEKFKMITQLVQQLA